MSEHIHIIYKSRADTSVSEMLRIIKSNSSKWVNTLPHQNVRFQWQGGYAGTVSESQSRAVIQYAQNQEEHHRGKTFQKEYVEFLKKHRIDYDERFIWD